MQSGRTALYWAVSSGQPALTLVLLDGGAAINACDMVNNFRLYFVYTVRNSSDLLCSCSMVLRLC